MGQCELAGPRLANIHCTLPCVRHCFRCFPWIISLHAITPPRGKYYGCPHFTDNAIEAQQVEATCPEPHCWKVSATGMCCNGPVTNSSFPSGHLTLTLSTLKDPTKYPVKVNSSCHLKRFTSLAFKAFPLHPPGTPLQGCCYKY